MPFRFRKSIRVLPNVRINLNRHSTTVSIGVKGAHTTFRSGRTPRTTLSLPGTGVSYTSGGQTAAKAHHAAAEAPGRAQTAPIAEPPQDERLPVGVAWRGWLWIAIGVLIVAAFIWSCHA